MTDDPRERLTGLLAEAPVFDGHNDLAWELREQVGGDVDALDLTQDTSDRTQTDFPRLRAGGVGAQFWSVYVPSDQPGGDAITQTLEQIDIVHRLVQRYPDRLRLALTADDVEAARREGRIASLLGAEGGQSINESLGALRVLYRLGVRYMTLTHNDNLPWADSATDEPVVGGLNEFGVSVVREMNRLGMLVDLSHVAPTTMHAALDATSAPVIFSHSSARAVCDHPRNVPDDVLARMADNGGVVMATFVAPFVSTEARDWVLGQRDYLKAHGFTGHYWDEAARELREAYAAEYPAPEVTAAMVADHVDHLREVAGVDHVGLGGDFDGSTFMPVDLKDVADYPNLLAELLRRGWSDDDVRKLTWRNAVRVLRAAQEHAKG